MTDHPDSRPDLTAYLAEFGARLRQVEPLAAHPERDGVAGAASAYRGRWRRPLAATFGVALAGLAAALVIAPAVTPVDPVSEARAALGDAGDLVHFVVVAGNGREGSDAPCAPERPTEVWQATSGKPRWRVVQPGMPKRCGTMMDWDGTRLVGPIETARDGDTHTTWVPQIGRLTVITETGFPNDGSDLPWSFFLGPQPTGPAAIVGDPIGRLRALLDEGALREGHRSRIAAREVVHLVGTAAQGSGSGQGVANESRFDLAVDARTFAPVRFITRSISDFTRLNPKATASGDGWETWTATFLSYEQHPLTSQLARELTIRPATKPTTELRFTRAEFQRRAEAHAKRQSELGRRNAARAHAKLARERAAERSDK